MSEWTTETLYEHFTALLADQAALGEARHVASQVALERASKALEKRLDSMNEFRDQLRDQASLFMPRSEYQARQDDLQDRIERLNDQVTGIQGRSTGLNQGWAYLVAFVGIAGVLVAIAVRVS